ncbi:MAG: hypothetical protein FWE78_06070 [Methanimicrococcus sp.]|nr:hypothetical protein [Methanimicrococcus sp.]
MEERYAEIEGENEKKIEIIKMGKFSFELEEKREQNLILQAGHMLTGFSIISVMLLAIIPILLDYTKIPNKIVFLLLGTSLLFLVFSLLFTVGAQWRYKHLGLESIKSIYDLMSQVPLNDVNDWWLENLNEIYNAKNDVNEKRVKLMKFSTLSFGISILTILIYLIVSLIMSCIVIYTSAL